MKNNLLFDFIVNKEEKSILIKREFLGSLSLVWKAWTTAELLDQWWGPLPWRAETKTMDFREGGFWLYAMVGPNGERHWSKVDYLTIDPQVSFSQRDGFCDEEGNMNPDFPRNDGVNSFKEKGDRVEVTMFSTFDSFADLQQTIDMGFKEGITIDFLQLDDLLEKLS